MLPIAFYTADNLLADRGGDIGVAALAAFEALNLLDQHFEALILARIEDDSTEEAGFAQGLPADWDNALRTHNLWLLACGVAAVARQPSSSSISQSSSATP
jgi:hypothetical protein